MTEEFYTHALWRVKPGNEERFVAAWQGLGKVFFRLKSPSPWGTLLQSVSDPAVFYSFGPWTSLDAIQSMRDDPVAREALRDLLALCEEATPSTYRRVAHMEL